MRRIVINGILPTLFILLINTSTSLAQETHRLRGYIFSQHDSTPLSESIAYIEGSTLSATTNDKGKFEISNIPIGRRWLVVEKNGYQALTLPVEFNYGLRNVDTLYLEKETEKAPPSFSDKTMASSLRKFRQGIFGQSKAKNIRINNPGVFRITEIKPLKSSEPFHLQITNDYLGYEISYWVRKFDFSKDRTATSHYIEASMLFTPKQASSEKEERKWAFNRQHSYRGSLRHFLKQLVNKSLEEAGFVCYIIKGNRKNNHDLINNGLRLMLTEENLTEYITYSPDKFRTANRLKVNNIIEVLYIGESDSQGNAQRSYIIPTTGFIQVYDNGTMPIPSQISVTGFMALQGLYEMLPTDY